MQGITDDGHLASSPKLEEYMASPFATFIVVMVVILVAIVVVAILLSRSSKKRINTSRSMSVRGQNSPLLIGMVSRHGELALVADGYTPSDMRFSYIMSLSLIYSPNPLYGLYVVELPFVAAAHVLGLTKGQPTPLKVDINSSTNFEKMTLEGDYPNYFDLYVEKDQQMEGRYVLDPKAMVFTVDFCRNFNWEIVGSSLFFLSASELPTHAIVDQFVAEIRPAVDTGKPTLRHSHDLPYVTVQPLKINCPICQARLKPGDEWLLCPSNHGILVTGGQLIRLRQSADPKLLASVLAGNEVHDGRVLACPHCGAEMRAVKYQNSGMYIDSCSMCRYRWLDYQETDEIAGIEQALLAK